LLPPSFDVNSTLESLNPVDVDRVSSVSETHADSIFRFEVRRVGEFLYIHRSFFETAIGRKLRVLVPFRIIGAVGRKNCET
jgi:hypothetical protein